MAQALFPLPALPDEETAPEVPPGVPVPSLRGVPAHVTATPPGIPAPLPPELLERALTQEQPWLEQHIPRRERSLPSEVISAGFRGALPGTIGALGQAAEAVGLPSVGKPLQSAAKSLRQTYPGLFEPSEAAQQPGVTRAIASGVEGLATSIGVSVPTLLATAASGGTGFVPLMAAYILGSPAVLSAASYQQFYDAAKKAGVPEDIASSGAVRTAVAEAIPELISNTLGALLIGRGLTKAASQAIIRKITGELGKDVSLQAALKPTIASTLANLGASAGVEAGTEGVTQVLQQKIAADTGLPVESAVGEAMGAGLVAGAIFGTLGRGGARLARGRDLQTLSNPQASPEARLGVASKIGEQLQAQDPELGQSFLDFTTQAIQNQEPIPVGVPFREMLAGQPAPAPTPEPTLAGPVQQEAMAEPPIETVRPPIPGMPVPRQPVTPPFSAVQQEAVAEPPIETVVEPPPSAPVTPPVVDIAPETAVPPPPAIPQPMPTPSASVQQVAQAPTPDTEIPLSAPAPQIQPSAAVQQVAQTPAVTVAPPVEVPGEAPSAPVPRPRTGDVPDWPVDRIQVDADRFQFKQASGQGGRTGSLSDIERYNPDLQGVLLVWQDPALPAEADPFVINGHNRLDAARRFEQPTHPVRFIQASTAQAARAVGALSNIADGKGTIFDAAKFFRDTGLGQEGLATQGIALHEAHARQALALANLHPFLFAEANQGRLPQARAVLIGEKITDPQRQLDFVKLLDDRARKGQRLTNDAISELIDFTLTAPQQTTTEETLFGVDERTESLALDKARLSDYIRKRLRDEKRIFGTVGRETAATELARAGNVIDVAGSQAIAVQAATTLDLYDRLKLLSGPVGDVLNAGADALGRGESRRHVEQRTYDRLLDVLRTTLPASPTGSAAGVVGVSAGPQTPAGPEPGPGTLFSTAPAGTPTGLTQADVEAVFRGQAVDDLGDGRFRVHFPHARPLDLKLITQLPMGPEQQLAFEVGYSRAWDPVVDPIAGRFTPATQTSNALLEFVIGSSDRVILRHEVQHFLEYSGLLAPDEVQALERAMQRGSRGRLRGTEARAQWVAEHVNARDYRQESRWGQVLDKVWAFFDRLLALAGMQTSRGVIRRIAEGEVFTRDTALSPGPVPTEQFAVAPPQPSVPEPLQTEQRLLVDLMGVRNLMPPEILTAVRDLQLTGTKYVVPTTQRQQAGAKILAQWDADPALWEAKKQEFHEGRLSNSAEHEAMRMLAKRGYDLISTYAADTGMSGARLHELLSQSFGGNSAFANLDSSVGMHVQAAEMSRLEASEAGRILRAQQDIPTESRVLDRIVAVAKELDLPAAEIDTWVQAWRRVEARDNPQEMQAFMQSIKVPSLWDYLMEVRYGSMLLGPSTQLANAAGNLFWGFWNQSVIRGLEGVFDHLAVKKLQQRDQQRFVSEVWPALTGMARVLNPLTAEGRRRLKVVPAFIRGGHEALQAPEFADRGFLFTSKFERDVGQHQEVWKHARYTNFDHPALESIGLYNREKTLAVLKKVGIEPGKPVHFRDYIAPAVTLATRALTAVDFLSKMAAYDAEIAGGAQRQAEIDLRAGRLQGQTVTHAREAYIAHPPEAIHLAAVERVQYLTFMDPVSGLGKLALQGRELPLFGKPLHALLPFVATPDRLIARAIDLIPLVGLLPYREVLYQHKSSQDLTALLARQAAGLLLATAGILLYQQGLLTGAPPEDAGEREAFYREGKQAYAVKLGDTWLSYRRFEPLNLVLSLFPVGAQALQRAEAQGRTTDYLSALMYTAMAMTQQVVESSYFSGLEPIFGAMQGRNEPAAVLARQVDSFIPFQALRATLQRSVDAYQTERGSVLRNPQAFWHHIAGVPLIADVALKYNVWGQSIVIPGTVTAQFLPYRLSTASRDPVEAELSRLNIYPGPPAKRDRDGTLYPQATYDALAQTRGQLAKARLDTLVRLPSWPLLSDDTRKTLIRQALREASTQAQATLTTRPGVPLGVPVPNRSARVGG